MNVRSEIFVRNLFGFVLMCVAGCSTSSNVQTQDIANPTLSDLQGEWRMVTLFGDGEACPPEDLKIASFVLTIGGSRFTIRDGNQKVHSAGDLVIDESTTPTHLDFIDKMAEGKPPNTTMGIIRIRQGRIQWCYATQVSERPTVFAAPLAPKGKKAALAEYERLQ